MTILNANLHLALKDFSKIYFYCADPGAFFIMEPVYLELRENGVDVAWVFDGWSRENVTKYQFMEYDAYISMIEENRYKKNECVIIGKRSSDHCKNWSLVKKTRENDIHSIFFVDFWANYLTDYLDPETKELNLPHTVFIMDDEARTDLLNEISPHIRPDEDSTNIVVVGHPGIEQSVKRIAALQKEMTPLPKEIKRHTILLVLEPRLSDSGKSDGLPLRGYDEFSFLDYFAEKYDWNDSRVIIKPHPRQVVSEISEYIERATSFDEMDYEMAAEADLDELLAMADEVVGMTSTVLILALHCGKKITSIQPNRSEEGTRRTPRPLAPYVLT